LRASGSANGHAAARTNGSAPRPPKATTPLKLGPLPLSTAQVDRLAERIEAWLLGWLVERAGIPRDDTDREKPFSDYGLDSLTAVEMSQELEQWLGVELSPILAWNYPTPLALSRYLARKAGGHEIEEALTTDEAHSTDESRLDEEFEELLAEIEGLSESETHSALAGQEAGRKLRGR
jgi:acyl carrier protein